jgi:acetyl esterase
MSKRFTGLQRAIAMGAVEQFYNNLAYWAGKVPRAHPSRHGVEVVRNVGYDENSSAAHHMLDVYRPVERNELLPVVLYVHGGGFRILSKDTHWVFGLGFARQGYVVFNINYRLAPAHGFPAAPMDVCKAYQWVAENAERFGGDPSRIILAGESAGANLVTMLAVATSVERPEPWTRPLLSVPPPIAAMPCCGLHQVSDSERFARRRKLARVITFQLEQIGLDYLGKATEAELADPLLILESAPTLVRPLPTFLATVGTRDPLLDDTRRLGAALEALDVPCETRYYPGEVHAFHALVWRARAQEWWRDTLQFMAEVAGDPVRATAAR